MERLGHDPKLNDRGVRRGTCTVGGKAAAEAGAVTHGAVRCSAWLGVAAVGNTGPSGEECKDERCHNEHVGREHGDVAL